MNSGDTSTEKEAKKDRKNENKECTCKPLKTHAVLIKIAATSGSTLPEAASKLILSISSLANGGRGSKKEKKLKAFTPAFVCNDHEQDRSDSIMRDRLLRVRFHGSALWNFRNGFR